MKNKNLKLFLFAFITLSYSYSTQCMDEFNKGFRKGLGKGLAKGITSNNDKGVFECILDLLWINFLLGPSSTGVHENKKSNNYNEIIDYKPRARFLTKLVRNNDIFNFKNQKNRIQNNSEIELEGLNQYKIYLQNQVEDPYLKSFRKITLNGLCLGGITTVLGIASYYSLKFGMSNHEKDTHLIGAGIVFGISALLSGLFTKERIKKHLPSNIVNRKNKKIGYVETAIKWAKTLRDHIDGTDLKLED